MLRETNVTANKVFLNSLAEVCNILKFRLRSTCNFARSDIKFSRDDLFYVESNLV